MNRLILICVLSGLVLTGCQQERRDLPTISTKTPFEKEGTLSFLTPAGDTLRTIDIEIAETEQARATGMMGRRGLPQNSGMLFIMDDVDTSGFWMKNTPLPLDIIFVGPDSQIINIAKRTTPFSEQTIRPDAPKKYVVEVRGGYADRVGITDSMRIVWERVGEPAL